MNLRRVFYSALGTSLLAILTMSLGSYVSKVGAGMACPDWPLCPLENDPFILLEFGHRIVAFITFLSGVYTFYLGWRTTLRPLAVYAFAALLLQVFVVGAVVIFTAIPPIVIAAHQAVAATVLALHSSLATAAYVIRIQEKHKNTAPEMVPHV
ncbi:cytochrome AA3 controlling protein [Candidatus Caldarchaeum subterraneum]|uniref:Cytochrome AA3 controlling protein n=1 Tax=Caldiarchaeum subterraneum TaxID=311458 RepID=E6N8L6_CALS0|nr:cytochrome AA3 controlling protein [Candidatus Caldarchaeum subterraneum]BAJ51340.1 cytochrome AA3 controlling protein [Candidatus Caldarchaeum subterraneum]GBC72231.1 Heme A synthase [archaeon HR03]